MSTVVAPQTLTERETYSVESDGATTGEALCWAHVISAVSGASGSRLPVRIRLHGLSLNPALIRTIAKLYALGSLRHGWDSYGAQPIRPEIIECAARWVPTLLQPSTPEPAVVPQVHGGLQFEWHIRGIDIEIYVDSPTNIRFAAEDLNSGHGVEVPFAGNEELLRSWIARISG